MKKLLVVVDYQNDFVDGALGFEGARDIEAKIVELIKKFKANGDFICYTMDTHERDYLSTVEGSYLPIEHCIRGSEGWKLTRDVDEVKEFYPVFEKAGFPSLTLGNYIHGLSPLIDEIYLCGLVSDICVFSNAIIAKAACGKNCKVKVIENATSSNDLDMQEKSFEMLKHLHIEVVKED